MNKNFQTKPHPYEQELRIDNEMRTFIMLGTISSLLHTKNKSEKYFGIHKIVIIRSTYYFT
jgi:hypothetical protein